MRFVSVGLFLVAAVSFVTACGGGGGGGGSGPGHTSKNSAPAILNLQTPKGLQGKRGADPVNGLVQIIYQLRDKQFDPVEFMEVEFGVDPDLTDGVDEFVYLAASEGPGGDGTVNLDASPGGGALHFFVWDTLADIGTTRHMRLDYAYTDDGRVVLDGFGEPVFVTHAGAKIRLRTIVDGVPGEWEYTDAFDVNNNNAPVVTVQGVQVPPEGVVNEYVMMNWTAIDLDSDRVTVAVDWEREQ
jgi:hypothetical protein